jgi:hypothetical protein
MIKKSEDLITQSKKISLTAKNTDFNRPYVKQRIENSASLLVEDAYGLMLTALISEISFINALRADTWTVLQYYPSVELKKTKYASLTFHRKLNTFNLFVPTHGQSLVMPADDSARVLKNSESANAQTIDVMLPESYTPLIKKFLKCRDLYIKRIGDTLIPRELISLEDHLSLFKEVLANPDHEMYRDGRFAGLPKTNIDSILKIYIDEYQKSFEAYKKFNPKNINSFMPSFYMTRHRFSDIQVIESSEWKNRRASKRLFIMEQGDLTDLFKDNTHQAYNVTTPYLTQNGVNIHANRHLSVTTYLDKYPGSKLNAASILNDEEEQVSLNYDDRDRSKAQVIVAEQATRFNY